MPALAFSVQIVKSVSATYLRKQRLVVLIGQYLDVLIGEFGILPSSPGTPSLTQ
jgi:hypothetical protein